MTQHLELTRRGWSLCGAACGLVIASRLLGVVELLVTGVVGLVLLAGAALWVRAQRPDLVLDRSVGPARIHVGGDGRVDLVVTNHGSRPTPLVSLDERFGDGRRAARFLLPSLAPGGRSRAAYRIPTVRRGCYRVGPLVATVSDPFGVVQRLLEFGPVDEVTVYPRIHEIASPPLGGGRRATIDTVPARSVTLAGDEFATLREYEVGDDLRKVHWPATARTGELFIRQDTSYREPRVVVVLDTRPEVHDDASFELAVEVVASLVVRLTRDARRLAVRTTTGTVICRSDDAALGLDRLSAIATGPPGGGLDAAAVTDEALLVMVTGQLDRTDGATLRQAIRPRRPVILVTTARGAPDAPGAVGAAGGTGVTRVDASGGDFVDAWNRSTLVAGGRRAGHGARHDASTP